MMRQKNEKAQRRGQTPLPADRHADPFSRVGNPLPTSFNADVPQHVVQQLLDHMSPEMTAVYARLHLDTVRRHWENALKVNADGDPAALPEDHPLASAQWMRVSMVRAKVTLPNGYCGAPVQTDCEYANPCLDCRFFITTPDFLAQHRQQREETRQMIARAEDGGLARVAEKNTRTLGRLDKIITTLEQAGPARSSPAERSPASMPPADNSRYLAEASRQRHEQARDRATRTIDAAARRGTAPTVAGIASAAGVSRSWLYTQDDLRAAIDTLKQRRPAPSRTGQPTAASDESLRRRLEASQARGKQLREENTDLKLVAHFRAFAASRRSVKARSRWVCRSSVRSVRHRPMAIE
jgi:Family of unknown function (DUF6262)